MATHPPRSIRSTTQTLSPPTLNLCARTSGAWPCLAVLVGPAGAGKSTFAASNWPGPPLSLDECRRRISPYRDPSDQSVTPQAVRLWHRLLRQELAAGESVCADATSIVPGHRLALIRNVAEPAGVTPVAFLFRTPLSVCRARNAERPTATRVPEPVIAQQFCATPSEHVLRREPFAAVHVVSATGAIHA